MINKKYGILIGFLLSLLILSACSDNNSVEINQEQQGDMDEKETDVVEEEVSDNAMEETVNLPDDFPDDVPFPESYSIAEVNDVEKRGLDMKEIMYETENTTKEELKSKYLDYGKEKGYEVIQEMESEGSYSVQFSGEDIFIEFEIYGGIIQDVYIRYGF